MKKIFISAWPRIFCLFTIISALTRTVFLIKEKSEINFSPLLIIKIYSVGFFLDFVTFCYFAFIPLLYYILVPNKFFIGKNHLRFVLFIYFIFIYLLVFNAVAEWFFWEEFSVRFNFIAVDYLIYTTEVIGNIVESYPLYKIIFALAIAATILFLLTYKKILQKIQDENNFFQRLKSSLILLLVAITSFLTLDSTRVARISENNYVNEITYNGIYQLFSAYRNNQLDYEKFYLNKENNLVLLELKNKLSQNNSNIKFLSQNPNNFWQIISKSDKSSPEKKYNVIFVTVESFSAEFLGALGNKENLTPNLDKIVEKSLFFTNLKATGTRTVRGLEALSLSIPPTPGNSIIRRPHNENLFNISTPYKQRGYDVSFIYGGHGYFDNMNYFFENNGFKIIDRSSFDKNKIAFANVWGVSDEDLFNKTIDEADKSYKAGKPFFSLVMTTSNHRPFTYPEGRIDIKSKTGRGGAVKYTDYAIGKLIADAGKKPWFKNTIFVIIADHCAGSAGNSDLPLWRYQIPAIFYAPDIIKPQKFTKNISQIDIAPTLLGLMNFTYKSNFIGQDILNNKNFDERSFISTYSKLGYYKKNKLYILDLKKDKKIFDVKINKYGWNGSQESLTTNYDAKDFDETINYYQAASYLFNHGFLKNDDSK